MGIEKFIKTVRSLPENVRKMLAGAMVLIFAVLVFAGWSSLPSLQLANLETSGEASEDVFGQMQQKIQEDAPDMTAKETSQKILSPLEGIAGTIKSLQDISAGPADQKSFWQKNWIDLEKNLKRFWSYFE